MTSGRARSRADAAHRNALENRKAEASADETAEPPLGSGESAAVPETGESPLVEQLEQPTRRVVTAAMLAALAPPVAPELALLDLDKDDDTDSEIDEYSITPSDEFFGLDAPDVDTISLLALPPVQLPVPVGESVDAPDWQEWTKIADVQVSDEEVRPEIPAWATAPAPDPTPVADAATPEFPAWDAGFPSQVNADAEAGTPDAPPLDPPTYTLPTSDSLSEPTDADRQPAVADEPVEVAASEVVSVDGEVDDESDVTESFLPVAEIEEDGDDEPDETPAGDEPVEVEVEAAPELPSFEDILAAPVAPAIPVPSSFGGAFSKAAPVLPGAVIDEPVVAAVAPIIVQIAAPAAAPAPEQSVQVVYVDGPAPSTAESLAAAAPSRRVEVQTGLTRLDAPELPVLPSIADDAPFVELPDIATAPFTPQAPKKAREPMFVWRGKPIGGGKAEVEPSPAPRTKKGEQRAVPQPRSDFDPSQTKNIDSQTWFADSLSWALDRNASDVHVVLDGKTGILNARVRIDGILRPFATIENKTIASSVMGIFKTAAGMHSVSSFIPEESLYEVIVDGEKRTARAAMARDHTEGNALVLRLPSTGAVKHLEELGFSPANLATLKKMLSSANRMLIFAGPMGAGKTSTAHGALLEVATPGRSVWSIEDPVERDIPGVVQIQADESNKAGFAELLPFLVRSDYDTLFLGEIRDQVTAAAGVRQAKAGRQVITTIHAEDNIIALYRLIELAEDTPLSCMSAVRGIVSQRLLRRLNPDWDGTDSDEKYKGRVPIHEILRINDELTEAVMANKPLGIVKEIAIRASTSTFATDSQRLIDEGVTDMEEVNRVLGADND